METPYDEFDVKHEQSRKEPGSTIISGLHKIPKKIADISQTQGVSEKFLLNGQPSGVINPSMLAQDRYLSAVDATQDASIMTFLLVVFPLTSVNWLTIPIFAYVILYWFFHVSWWEKTRIWGVKGSAKKYVKHTTSVYWFVFFTLMIPASVGLWYFIFELSYELVSFSYINTVLSVTNGAEKALYEVFGNIDLVKSVLSPNPHHAIDMSSAAYEQSFILVSAIFFITTFGSKFLFRSMYKKETRENIELSQTEMQYSGEAALSKIKKAQNESR